MTAIAVERLLTWMNRTRIGVAHHVTALIFYNITRCYGKQVAVFAVAVATGDIIKYQSFVYGSFVWGIHVRYNNLICYTQCPNHILDKYLSIRELLHSSNKGHNIQKYIFGILLIVNQVNQRELCWFIGNAWYCDIFFWVNLWKTCFIAHIIEKYVHFLCKDTFLFNLYESHPIKNETFFIVLKSVCAFS